jgi:hypothetical protein
VTVPARLAGFGAALALLFGGGALAGGLIDPDRDEPATAHGAARSEETSHVTASTPTHAGSGADAAHSVRGLAVAENGLRLVVETPELQRGHRQTLRFRVVDEHGSTVRDFDVEHTKRMHLIVARRDLTGFQHLHPRQRPDGTWTTPLRLADAGSYRVFADFSHRGEPATLAADLRVDGDADLRPLPAPAATAAAGGGYEVRLDAGRVRPGREADLRFTVTKDGRTVHPQPYLGAGGHLVALREGDLAFLHVHPAGHGHEQQAAGDGHDDSIRFAATFPTESRYRLFLQFKDEGRVQTVAFTQEVR